MADEVMGKHGLHFDELNKIRVLQPEVAQETSELKEECKDFVDSKFSFISRSILIEGPTYIFYSFTIS